MKKIFLDNASTTTCMEECLDIIVEYSKNNYFNPSAQYHEGLVLTKTIKSAKQNIVKRLRGDGDLVITSSGTESNNLALFGTKKRNNSQIIISNTEHPAVKNTSLELKQRGFDVVLADVDSAGRVIVEKFAELVTEKTSLISIMHVNNETGCINDIKNLVAIAKKINPNVIFHSDGVQAVGKVDINLKQLGVDLYTISGHKIHAPKGVAGLYVKNGVTIKPQLFGGGQENNIRSSTENVAGIMCLDKAIDTAISLLETVTTTLNDYKNMIIESINQDIKIISDSPSSPFILCLAMPYIRGEVMLHSLEKYDILIGTGSACSSKKGSKLSKILELPQNYINGIIRISFSRFTSKTDIEYFIKYFNLEYNNLIKYVKGC